LVEIALMLFWLGLALQIPQLVVASAIILSYLALALVFGSGLPLSVALQRRLSLERVTEGQTVTSEMLITNESDTPCLINVHEEYPYGLELLGGSTDYLAFVPSNSQRILSNVLNADFRGHYLLPQPISRTTDELNLRERQVLETGRPSYLTILPRIEDLSDFPVSPRSSQPEIGSFRSGSVGVGTEFFGIRDYLPGDDIRRINWKASARTDFLLSNEYEREHVTNICLIADLSSPARDDLKWVVRTSASIATYLLRTRNRLGLVVLGEGVSYVRIETGRRQLLRVLDKLVTAEPGGTGESNTYLRRLIDDMPRCEIFVVSPLKSEAIANTAIEVRGKRERVSVITSREVVSEDLERDLIFRAAKRLYDLKRGAIIHRMKNAEVRVVEVPFDTALHSVVSLIEERPIRR
jgi:uncharacterized protein (DUF58 family)